jgi:hypothetical protein
LYLSARTSPSATGEPLSEREALDGADVAPDAPGAPGVDDAPDAGAMMRVAIESLKSVERSGSGSVGSVIEVRGEDT